MYKYINCNGDTLINCEQVIAYYIEEQELEWTKIFEVYAKVHGTEYILYSGCNHEQATEIINIVQKFLLDSSTHVLEIKGNKFIQKKGARRYKSGK